MYLGSFIIDDTCTFYCNAHTPSTGAAVDADAVPGYRLYEDETGTPILTGSYALLDDANTLGFYSEQITLSAANGFEVGKSYSVRTTIVVGGVTGVQIDRLQIGARVDVRMLGGSVQSSTDLQDFADDGYDPATNKVQGVVLVDTMTTYTGNTPQTGDVFPLASTEIADIKAKTDNLPTDPADQSLIVAATDAIMTRIGVAGAGLTALGDGRIANLDATVSSRLATAGYTAPPTAAVIADAVLDEDMTAHQTQGSLGQAIGDPAADTNTIYKAVVTDAAGVNIAADIIEVKAQTAAIEIDTAVIGTLGAGLTALATQASVDAVKADTAAILIDTGTTLDAALAVIDSNVDAILVDTGTTLQNELDAIQVNVDAILIDTAEIGVAGAGLTAINLPDQTMNIIGNITGNLSGSVGSVTGAVGSVTGAVGSVTGAVGGNVNGNVLGSVGSVIGDVSVAVASKTGYTLTTADKQLTADVILDRDIAGGASGGARNVRSALRYQRNKVEIVAGTLTVYQEDDTTPAWEATVATTAGNPISSIDPST